MPRYFFNTRIGRELILDPEGEELRDPEELAAVRRLRALLADLAPVEAATLLRERIESTQTNAELLAGL